MIYLDNSATTKLYDEAFEKMKPYFGVEYANPSAGYGFATRSRHAIEEARENIAKVIGANSKEIFFTSGGSESDNWALKAALDLNEGRHIITSRIEHPAILNTCKYLESKGYMITYLNVNDTGVINLDELKNAIRKDTALVSVMAANNEIGTIEPLKEIGKICKENNILFHTDAVQAYGHIPLDVKELNIDMLSASAHKFHGPKGVGFLYINENLKLPGFIQGGSQEKGKRAGTYNVPGIVGMGEAARIVLKNIESNIEKETALRDYLIKRVKEEIPNVKLNGDEKNRLPGNTNFSFPGLEGESLLIQLDMKDICVSSGSACASGSLEPSHVLQAIGLSDLEAKGSLRLTLSYENTIEEINETVDALKTLVEKLRNLSPMYEEYLKTKKGLH